MDDFTTSLLAQQEAARPRTGEELETLGKYAAARYHKGGGKLTDMVVETVKSAGLSPEQVRRVVEFANQAAYLAEFNKEGSSTKVVNFRGGPADPAAVLQDLNDGGGGSVFDSGSDYHTPPGGAKLASRNEQRMGVGLDKLASVFGDPVGLPYAYSAEAVTAPAVAEYEKLSGMHAHAHAELCGEEARFYDLCDVLTYEVKMASLRGTPLSHIVAAWGAVNDEPEFMKAAFQAITGKLVDSGVFSSRTALVEALTEKTAALGEVNPQHPLVSTYRDFCECITKMATLRQISGEFAEGAETLLNFVRDVVKTASVKTGANLSVARKGGGLLAQIPKAWRGATQLASSAAAPVRSGVRDLAEGAGVSRGTADMLSSVAGGAVEYAPHMAAGLAAEEAYQHARYNPLIQGVKNFTLSRVPYTHQNLVRQFDLQQRMMF